jgi:uncharacterized protein YcaQ
MAQRFSLSSAQARRVALDAQGFGNRTEGLDARRLLAAVRRLGVIQIDSVNVLVRSHYLPLFSRFGPYDRTLLERLAYRKPRKLLEYWAHEASFVPMERYPLFRWRMARAAKGDGVWGNVARVGSEKRDLVKRVEREFAENGPLSASQFPEGKGTEKWWGWNDTKRAVEFLFWSGRLAVVKRQTSFERVYDLAERVIPPELLNAPALTESDAKRELVAIGAQALGVATEADLRDYFRLDVTGARRAVAELVEAGTLAPVTVEGWKQQAYLDSRRRIPRGIEGSALLSPFDSLVWNRARTHRLFDFHYRIEIYTPAHKRIHGYYVLPYLIDDRLVARIDLKSDRQASTLRVQAVHYEPGIDKRDVQLRLRADLQSLAQWLDLARVAHTKR